MGAEQAVEHGVDHRVGDARVILAALDLHLAGVEVLPLFQAGTEGLRQGHEDHVVVELVQALLVLGAVDGAQARVDADAGEVFAIGLENTLQARIDQQDFEAQRFALFIQQSVAGQLPAGIGQ